AAPGGSATRGGEGRRLLGPRGGDRPRRLRRALERAAPDPGRRGLSTAGPRAAPAAPGTRNKPQSQERDERDMDNGTSRAQVRRIVGEMSPLGAREANSGDRHVEDLGYDSLAVIELSLRIEQEFTLVDLGTGPTADITTVKDIEDFVVQQQAAPSDAA